MKKIRKAFTLIEMSIVLLVISMIALMLIKGPRIVKDYRLQTARALTRSSEIISINNMVLWLETSLGGTLINTTHFNHPEDNDPISLWNDGNQQTAAKVNPSQATTSKMPLFVSEGIGGIPSLRFDGVDDFLRTGTSEMVPLSKGDDTYTMVVVWKYDATATSVARYLISQNDTTGASNTNASIYVNSSDYSGFSGSNNNYAGIAVNKGFPYITIVRVNNNNTNNISLFYNTNTAVSGGSDNDGPLALDLNAPFFEIGSFAGGTFNFFSGLISEIIIFDRDLKNEEIQTLNRYLGKKYSIRIS